MGTCSGTGGGECGSGGKDVTKDERRVDMKGYVLLSPVLFTLWQRLILLIDYRGNNYRSSGSLIPALPVIDLGHKGGMN